MRHKHVVMAFILFITLTISMISISSSQLTSSSNWLKKGAYAEYSFSSIGMLFYNGTYLDLNKNSTTTLRWDCVSRNDTTAKLTVTVTGFCLNGTSRLFSKNLYVDLLTRAVYLQNGTLIGTTTLWQMPNPNVNESLILWDVPPDRVEMTIDKGEDDQVETPQGIQEAFIINGKATGLESIGYSGNLSYILMYDFNTGVLADSVNIGGQEGEGVLKALNIFQIDVDGRFLFTDTNIDLGPHLGGTSTSTNVSIELILLFPVLFAIFFVVICFKNKRGKKRAKRMLA